MWVLFGEAMISASTTPAASISRWSVKYCTCERSAPSMLRRVDSDQLSEVCTGSQTAVTEAPSSR